MTITRVTAKYSSLFLVTAFLASGSASANALEPNTASHPSTSSNATSVGSAYSQSIDTAKGSCGVILALTCGIPIRTCKYIYAESRRMVKTLHDDFTDEPDISATLLASTFGIPYGIASGTVLGIVHGVEDGIKDGYNEPFSKKSIGL